MRTRLERWWAKAWATAKRRWWLWLALALLHFVQKRVTDMADTLVSSHQAGALQFVGWFILWLGKNPLGLMGMIGAILLLSLLVHAYMTSRQEQTKPVQTADIGLPPTSTTRLDPAARVEGELSIVQPRPQAEVEMFKQLTKRRMHTCSACKTIFIIEPGITAIVEPGSLLVTCPNPACRHSETWR